MSEHEDTDHNHDADSNADDNAEENAAPPAKRDAKRDDLPDTMCDPPSARQVSDTEEDASRREFLKVAAMGACGVGLVGVAAIPGAAYVAYPLNHATTVGGTGLLPAGKLKRFKKGVPSKVDFFDDRVDAWNRIEDVKIGSAWVVRTEDRLLALSSLCPHLGCAIDFDAESIKFKCPCHRSSFSLEGKKEEGPAPRAMDELDVVEEGGLVQVRYLRFKQGANERVPA
ncbi:MAG: Rieske 2Fe-2S domain-containing protein [Nannocystaceae bacterium]